MPRLGMSWQAGHHRWREAAIGLGCFGALSTSSPGPLRPLTQATAVRDPDRSSSTHVHTRTRSEVTTVCVTLASSGPPCHYVRRCWCRCLRPITHLIHRCQKTSTGRSWQRSVPSTTKHRRHPVSVNPEGPARVPPKIIILLTILLH